MEVYHQIEETDGIRMTWNILPNSKQAASKLVIPPAVCYTPFIPREFPDLGIYQPIRCTNCSAILNPFTQIEQNGAFTCLFCLYKNMIPNQVLQSLQGNPLPETHPSYTTNEFTIKQALPLSLIFIIDLSILDQELQALKQSILALLQVLPESTQIGLITCHKHVFIHDLSDTLIPRCYAFKAKEYTSQQFSQILRFNPSGANNSTSGIFLGPLHQVEYQFINCIEALKPSPWTTATDQRFETCTGTALQCAVLLLEQLVPKTAARLLTFIGGPCTYGPGCIVDIPLKQHLRSHHDIDKETATHYKKAIQFYDQLAKKASDNGHVIDLYTGCLDQVGLAEMRNCASFTNGVMVLSDSFNTSIFRQSLLKCYMGDPLEFGCCCQLQVHCSTSLKLNGCIGNCQSGNKKSVCVSDTQIGIGNTSLYTMGSIRQNSTYCFYFEPSTQSGATTGYIQFTTQFQQNDLIKLRVTTVARK